MGKKNKAQTIVETEPVVINEEAIVESTEVKEDEVIEVEAPEVIVEEKSEKIVETKVELEVLIAFSDKYTNEDYTVGKVITVDEDRAKELLDDYRKLVKKR